MDKVTNPFSPGAGNPPPELSGRHATLEAVSIVLQRVAIGKPVQYPVLVGLRGVGKTVLLVHARADAEARNFIVIEAEAHDGKPLPELLVPGIRRALLQLNLVDRARDMATRGLRVLKGFLGALKVKVGELELSMSMGAEAGTGDSGDLEADLPDLFRSLGEAAKAAGRPVVIVIDELQYLSDGEFSALIMAMHKINQERLPIAFVGAGLPQILALAGNSKSYSERLFAYHEIGALADADARDAVVAPLLHEGANIAPDAIDHILAATDRYPYFLQQWSYEAWNVAAGPVIDLADARAADPLAVAALDASFFRVRLNRCTTGEKNYMRALAELGPGAHRSAAIAAVLGKKSTTAAPIRDRLIRKGMIYAPVYGETAFTVPRFDEFMRRTIPDLSIREP